MAYDPTTVNSMQASLGLIPGWTPPQPMFVPPAMAAQQMQAQASQQLSAGMSMTRLPAATPSGMFGQQFQQQLQGVQSQQSFNPYIAQSLSGGMGGYQPGMMPSPLMMTPPSSGVFRPPPQMSMMAIPPQQAAPMMPGPFTPQLTPPMFQTAWDRETQQRDMRADRIYSTLSQGPRMGGMAAGFGAGALAGSQIGAAFGPWGRLAGAAGGAALAGISGFAGGVGDLASMPMRPSLEVHGMGASLQRMSQQWALTGPQIHQSGAGFSRESSIGMAAQIRGMASDRGFRGETGGGFNRDDLMKITESSGRAGLMDMEQGTDAVRNNLRQVSRVVKRFMALTGDPDVTSVIREMGQMRAFGMSVNDMERAAQNMKTFARAAGVSIQGLQQMGGLAGAMTYQQSGLSAATGMEMGNYAFAAARQAVSAGTYEPRDLARMGGVSGISQRNVQAQAALTSMPLFGAAIGSYGKGGWDVNYGNLAQTMQGGRGGQGAAGMVMGAVQNIGQAVARGGIGALAEYQLRQGHMQDEAAAAMHPAQQMAMRFKMAQQTGQTLGLQGSAAFTVGSRALFGDEVAEQMMMEARNPQAFREQATMLRRQNQDIARQQREAIRSNAPGFTDVLGEKLGIKATDRGIFTGGGSLGNTLSDMGTALEHNRVLHYFEDVAARERGERIQRVDPMAAIENEKQRQNVLKGIGRGDLSAKSMSQIREEAKRLKSGGWVQTSDTLTLASREHGERMSANVLGVNAVLTAGTLAVGALTGGIAAGVGVAIGGAAISGGINAVGVRNIEGQFIASELGEKGMAAATKAGMREAQTRVSMYKSARMSTTEGVRGVAKTLAGRLGGESGVVVAMSAAAGALEKKARSMVGVAWDSDLRSEDIENSIIEGFKTSRGMTESEARAMYNGLDQQTKDQLIGSVVSDAKAMGGDYTRNIFQKSEELGMAGTGDMSVTQVKEALAGKARQYEEMAGWGETGDIGAQTLRGKARELEQLDYLGMAAAADPSKMGEVLKRYEAGGGKDVVGFQKRTTEMYGKLSSQAKKALQAQTASQSISQIAGYVQTKRQEAGVALTEAGIQAVSKASGVGGLTGATSAEEMATQLSEGGMERLGKSEKYRGLTKLLGQFKGATGDARKKLADQIQNEIAAQGPVPGAGDTIESLTQPEGEQALQNEDAANALEGLAETLEDAGFDKFKEGAKDFVEGAKQLRLAMETDTMKKALGQI